MINRFMTGMRVRTALNVAIYKKSLVLSNGARRKQAAGGMINLMSGDTRVLMDVPGTLNSIGLSPFKILVSMVLIWRDLGSSAFAGFAGLLLLLPLGSKLRVMQRTNQVRFSRWSGNAPVIPPRLTGNNDAMLVTLDRTFLNRNHWRRTRTNV